MAMTSEEVSQLISSQTAAIAQANANATRMGYAQGLAEQGPQGDTIGAAIPSMAAGAASYAGNLPNAVMPAVSLAAGFGLLPRVLDPFTQSLSIGNVAAKAGGGWMGGGLAAGIGAAAIPFAAYTAAGAAADHLALDPFKTGAQMRGAALGAIQSYMPDSPMSSMGATASMMESMQRNKQFSMQDTMGLMSLGVAGGSINTNNMSQFQSSFKSLINETQQVAQALSSSLSEAYGAMQQIKGLGVSSASGTAYAMRGLGVAGGIAPAEMMGIAQGGASLAKMAGISRDVGVAGAMTSAATFGMVGNNKSLGADFGMDDLGMMQNAGYRFFGSRQGSSVVAAMMDESGDFDTSVATRIAQGTMTKAEINRRASITRNKRPDMLAANSTEIVAQYMSEYGPQGISNPLTTMVRGMANPESAKMQMTGLNQEGLGELSSLSMNSGSIKAQLSQAAQEGFNQGTQRLGLADSLQLAMQKMTAPIRDKFQQMGSQVAQSIAETVDDVTRDFMTRPAMRSDMSGANAIQSFNQQGNFTAANNVRSAISSVGSAEFMPHSSNRGFLANSFIPRGFYAGADGQNVELMDNNGMSPAGRSDAFGVHAGLALLSRGYAPGGILGEVGRDMVRGGGMAIKALPEAGMWGSRQALSIPVAAARGVQGAGWAARAVGKIAGSAVSMYGLALEGGLEAIDNFGRTYAGKDDANVDTSELAQLVAAKAHRAGYSDDNRYDSERAFYERNWLSKAGLGVASTGIGIPLGAAMIGASQFMGVGGNVAPEGMVPIVGTKSLESRALFTSEQEKVALGNLHLKNLPIYREARARILSKASEADKLAVSNIQSDPKMTAIDKQRAVATQLRIDTEEAEKVLLGDSNSPLFHGTSSAYAAEADKWFATMADRESNWANRLTGFGFGDVSDETDTAAARWGKTNRAKIVGAAQELMLTGKYKHPTAADFQNALKEKLVNEASTADRGVINTHLGVLSKAELLNSLSAEGALTLYEGNKKVVAANKLVNDESAGRTEKYIDYAATAAGIDPVGMRSAHKKFLDSYTDSTAQTKLVQGAVGSQELASAESQAIMAANLARDPSQFGQQASALLSIQARVKGLDEAYLDGKKSSGKKWVEEFLGIQVGGGVDKSLRGENDITPVKTRERIRKGVEQMLSANLGVDPAQFSSDQVSTVDITTRKIIRHAQEKDGGNVKEIAALFMPMKTSASPDKTEGQQAIMMQRMEKVVGALTEQLKNLSDRLPQTSGG